MFTEIAYTICPLYSFGSIVSQKLVAACKERHCVSEEKKKPIEGEQNTWMLIATMVIYSDYYAAKWKAIERA